MNSPWSSRSFIAALNSGLPFDHQSLGDTRAMIPVCRLGKTVIFLACILSNRRRATRPFRSTPSPSVTEPSSSLAPPAPATSAPVSVDASLEQSSHLEPGVEAGAQSVRPGIISSVAQSEGEAGTVDSSTTALSDQVNEATR